MRSIFSIKTKNEKILKDLDKRVSEIDKNVGILFKSSDTTKSSLHKKIATIGKELDGLYKATFDIKNFNLEIFEYILEKNIVNLLTSYVGLQNVELIKILLPLLQKILFDSKNFCEKIGMTEEILLISSSIINSLKILIHTLVVIVTDKEYDENMVDSVIDFLHIFMNKLIAYPNFYCAISASNESDNKGFDSAIFELIVQVFSKEYLMEKRESKSKLRKTLLLCLNLEHFYTINISYMEKLLEYLVDNLVKYYEIFKLFDPAKLINAENEKFIKKEKVSNEDLIDLNVSDTLSYLKYFSIITYCLSQPQLKRFLSNLLFNKLFMEYIQKDILNAYIMNDDDKKIHKVFEFIFYFTKYVKNRETNAILFYFFFGFNTYSEDFLNNEDNCLDNEIEPFQSGENLLSVEEIRINIEHLIKNNYNADKQAMLSVKIDKSSHKFENILSFLIMVIESTSSSLMDLKLTFLNILTNLVQNSFYLFLIDILVPYYLNYINIHNGKNFDKMYEKIRSSREKINLIEILKNVHPKYFSLNLGNWSEYFIENLDKNYDRNIFMLENLETETENDEGGSLKDLKGISNLNSSQMFLESYMNQDISYTPRKNNTSTNFTERTPEDDYDIDFSLAKIDNSGDSKDKDQIINNHTINLRINFYEILTKYFKKFHSNKYIENLYLTKLFLEIYSLPYHINKGEQGENIYNIYSNVTFAGKKKFVLFSIGSVGTISLIKSKLDEMVRFNFSKEEIDKLIQSRLEERIEQANESAIKNSGNKTSPNKKNSNMTQNQKNIEFLDNLILFNEFFKEYISNIFTKCYFDQINANYTNALKGLEK